MNNWQIGLMAEQEAAKEWERQNADDPLKEELQNAAKNMTGAIHHLMLATDAAAEAVAALKGTPEEDKVQSFVDELEDITSDIRAIQENFARGWRE